MRRLKLRTHRGRKGTGIVWNGISDEGVKDLMDALRDNDSLELIHIG